MNVVWARATAQDVMLASRAQGAEVGCDGNGAFCFTRFHIGFDALLASLKLAELLAASGVPLSTVVDSLPEIWQVERRVACPWDKRAAVMGALNDPSLARQSHSADSLVYGDLKAGERIVVLPRTDSPAIDLFCDSTNGARARALADEWEQLLTKAQR